MGRTEGLFEAPGESNNNQHVNYNLDNEKKNRENLNPQTVRIP